MLCLACPVRRMRSLRDAEYATSRASDCCRKWPKTFVGELLYANSASLCAALFSASDCESNSRPAAAFCSALAAILCVTALNWSSAPDICSIPCTAAGWSPPVRSPESSLAPNLRPPSGWRPLPRRAYCGLVRYPTDSAIRAAVSLAAKALRCARLRTSSATTAKPAPA